MMVVNGTDYHLRIDLRGALLNWDERLWVGCVTDDDGKLLTPGQVKVTFLDLLLSGQRFIPMDSSCDNFDPDKGCQGHPHEQETAEADR